MGGGLMQLVAYGAQDVYLTGNPQITMFKLVYRRHTNFSVECIDLSIETAKPGGSVNLQVLRNGDLATKCYLRLTTPDLTPTNNYNGQLAWVKRLGHAAVKTAEVQIGGAPIDKHWGVWLDIWYELTHTEEQDSGYRAMIGDVPDLTTLSSSIAGGYVLFIPFQFWFNRNYGLALPLIALQYHDVRFKIEFEQIEHLVVYTIDENGNTPRFNLIQYGNSGLLVDYVYLDSEERRRFAQVGHEYLIEQLQEQDFSLVGQAGNVGSENYTLNFNHPCKEMIFTHQVGAFSGISTDYTFLTYTNLDGADAWDDALQAGAEHLALGMINPELSQTPSGDSNMTAVELTLNTPFLTQQAGNAEQTLFRFTVVNPPTAYPSGWSEMYFHIVDNPLVSGNVNLADNLGAVSVDLDYDAATNSLSILAVNVTNHTLTLEDVSTPLQKFTDNRYTGSEGDIHVVQPHNYGLRLDGTGNMVVEAKIVFNGHDRFSPREGNYFNYVQPYQHHTHTPADGINVYSFALHPEQHQPSGTANMSRIDNTRLIYRVQDTLKDKRSVVFDIYENTVVWVFVLNYNILRIMSGMGGLAYSN